MTQDWALVTGASRGIGRSIAIDLARSSIHVIVNYMASEAAARAVVAEIIAAGGSAEPAQFDIRNLDETESSIRGLIERLGAPYAVINNAGVTRDGLMVWMKREEWGDVMDTSLNGFFNATRPCLKSMITARRGRIINITSVAGLMGNPGQVNYSAAKAGLIGATMALSREVARRGVTVNAVAPGFIVTDMTSHLPVDQIIQSIPLGRLGKPEDVAAAVRFLVSSEAGYITGQVLSVNGGIA